MKFSHALLMVLLFFSPFLAMGQQTRVQIKKALKSHNLNEKALEWQLVRQHISSSSKIHHIYYQQSIGGVLVRGTESSIHRSSTGKILSESNQFVPDISEFKTSTLTDVIAPRDALETVISEFDYYPISEFQLLEALGENENRAVFSNAGVSQRKIPVVLAYAPNKQGSYSLVWEVTILEMDYGRLMNYEVNALTGVLLKSQDYMLRCLTDDVLNEPKLNYNLNLYDRPNYKVPTEETTICEVCYEVFAIPLASPYDGERTIVQDPADAIASPFGWHDTDGESGAESFLTQGNNAFVSEQGDHRGYRTSGGELLDFTGFPFQPNFTLESQSEDAALTNVFYWNNMVHDIMYQYGFDELSNNFQKRNYSVSGQSGDFLEARVQGKHGCNAFYVSGAGGVQRPIAILSICEDKDAAFDTTVIIHEYGHGIVERLIGDTAFCLKSEEQMTEGWADYFGVLLTMSEDDLSGDRRPIANYFFGQGANGRGIRRYPYSADFNENPQTYGGLESSGGAHGVGSVWASMLWEMTWALIDRHGFDSNLYNFTGDINQDAGNVMALAIVIESMKLTPCTPGFVDARGAILIASEQIYGLDNQCTIFNAFAKRGLGLRADQGSPDSTSDGVEDFETMPTMAQIDEISSTCFLTGINSGLTGGLPLGGLYSGNGVIDDGNGVSFSINTDVSGAGLLLLNYEIGDSFCTTASSAQSKIDIVLDETPPEISCPENVAITIPSGDFYLLPNFRSEELATDFCSEDLVLSQEPQEFSELAEGVHPITMTATDVAGNTSECMFLLEVIWTEGPKPSFVSSVLLYPVPVIDELIVYNPSGKNILSILIQDINGRLIVLMNPSSKELRIPIDASPFSAGTYFLTIVSEEDTVIRRMIKV